MQRLAVMVLSGALIVVANRTAAQSTGPQFPCAGCDALVGRVEWLLPLRPFALRVVRDDDPILKRLGHAPEHVDGFVIAGDPVIYLRERGTMFQLAEQGAGPADCALAAIVWHEMAHQRGATEPEAQVEEERLWKAFVTAGLVDRERGTKYLTLLENRRRRGSRLRTTP